MSYDEFGLRNNPFDISPIRLELSVESVEQAMAGEFDWIIELIKTKLPHPAPKVHAGMHYTYPARHNIETMKSTKTQRYRVVELGPGEHQAIVERLTANRAGPIGSTLVEDVLKIQKDLFSGDAVVDAVATLNEAYEDGDEVEES